MLIKKIIRLIWIQIRNDDGMLGIVDSEGRSVIEPQWDNIYILNSNRFAVQKKINDVLKMGIIDSDENYITPFIYTKFISVDNDYLIGYFENETIPNIPSSFLIIL